MAISPESKNLRWFSAVRNMCGGRVGRIRFFRYIGAMIALLMFIASLQACAILPTEDESLPPPLLSEYERRQPTMAVVRRDDLIQTKTISCRSRPIREQTYSFPVGGIYIDSVYVTLGDSVSSGDMLAELERKEILTQIEEAKLAVRKQEYALEQAKDDTVLRIAYYSVQSTAEALESAGKSVDWPALIRQFDSVQEDYDFQVAYAEKMLEIEERKLATLLEMAEERVIYATIDGVVSYAHRFANDERSVAGDKAFTISDASELIYTVSGDDAHYFTIGEVYQMKVSKSILEIRAIPPEDIGEASTAVPTVYFIPDDLSAGLASYGYITVEINRRDNALYLPANAIIPVGDEYAVYRIGESGFRELSMVEVGVTISGKTEILGGLVEGDEVILG